MLLDQYCSCLHPILYKRPVFDFPNGIFSDLERVFLNNQNSITICIDSAVRGQDFYSKYFSYKDYLYKTNFLGKHLGISDIKIQYLDKENCKDSETQPAPLIENLGSSIINDVRYLNRNDFQDNFSFSYKGSPKDIFIHKSAEIENLVFINSEDGPVIIDSETKVTSFSYLKGPLYIGPKSNIDHATIESSRIGSVNRLGGEIADSILGNFSNKHHEGFVGHSIIGDWVNLGALTTTSDLKNNYGKIRLQYENKILETGTIKLGSIIGDYVKTAIGTMLNTGTIISTGSLIFDNFSNRKYFPPFFWGGSGENYYDLEKFWLDSEKIMKRRDQKLHPFEKEQLNLLYSKRFTV